MTAKTEEKKLYKKNLKMTELKKKELTDKKSRTL